MSLTFEYREDYGWTWTWKYWSYHNENERHLDWKAAFGFSPEDLGYEGGYYSADRYYLKDFDTCVDNFLEHCWPKYDSYAGRSLFYHCHGFICHDCAVKEFRCLIEYATEPELHTGPGEINEGWTPPTKIVLESGDDDYHLPGINWSSDFDERESDQQCEICNEVMIEQRTYVDYHELPYEYCDLPIFIDEDWHVMTGSEMVSVVKKGKAKKTGKQTYEFDGSTWIVKENRPNG